MVAPEQITSSRTAHPITGFLTIYEGTAHGCDGLIVAADRLSWSPWGIVLPVDVGGRVLPRDADVGASPVRRVDARASRSDVRLALAPIVGVIVAALAGLVLAPWIGDLLAPPPLAIWPQLIRLSGGLSPIDPEPEELVRFAVAALAPISIALIVLLGSRERRGRGWIRVETAAGLIVGPLIGVGIIGWITRSEPSTYGLAPDYFSNVDLAAAVAVAAGLAGVVLAGRPRTWIVRVLEPGPTTSAGHRRWIVGLGAVVVLLTVLWALPAVYTDSNLFDAPQLTRTHVPYTFADFAAFGNGATPLSDFAAQYSNLLPWVLHPVFVLTSYGPGSFTVVMGVLTVLGMLAMWRAIALAVGHEWVGAALYLPVLAVSLRPTIVSDDERLSNASLFQILPERYVVPLVVLWLCIRWARGLRPRSPAVIFFAAGLAFLNNAEFGGPCLVAACLALLVAAPEPPIRVLPRLAVQLVSGLAAAVVIVTAITVVRSGSAPDPAMLTYFSRMFGTQGFGAEPMPNLGFHLALYVTFVAALLTGAVRRAATASDRPLCGLLVFSGTLGLGASGYYVGRSNAITLVALFPIWGLCVAALVWLALRWLLRVQDRRALLTPRGAFAACALIGFGLVATDLPEVPNPPTQVHRLADASDRDASEGLTAAEEFVADRTRPGEPVLILRAHGHLVARGAGVRNVAFIGHPFHVINAEQLDAMLSDLRQAGGTTVFTAHAHPSRAGLRAGLKERGWQVVSRDPVAGIEEWRRAPSGP